MALRTRWAVLSTKYLVLSLCAVVAIAGCTQPSEHPPITNLSSPTTINLVQAASDLLWSRVLPTFPDLKFAMSEGGIGWIPYFLERIDYTYRQHGAWMGVDFGDRLPSDVFK